MMPEHPHLRLHGHPDLRDPAMIVAWGGWNDAGESASLAARFLTSTLEPEPLGEIDADEYYDFTTVRPLARYKEGQREIVWPTTDLYAVQDASLPRDLILVLGFEPNHRWRSYTDALLELIRTFNVGLVFTLGAVAAAVPHTRPVQVRGSANLPDLAERFDLHPSRFEGPTGIVGVFHDCLRRHDIPGISLWASVPHYLPGVANPMAARALLEQLESVVSLHLVYDSLDREIERFRRQVETVVEGNAKLTRYVTQLEEAAEAAGAAPDEPQPGELPTADGLIDELEQFLRRRRQEDA